MSRWLCILARGDPDNCYEESRSPRDEFTHEILLFDVDKNAFSCTAFRKRIIEKQKTEAHQSPRLSVPKAQ